MRIFAIILFALVLFGCNREDQPQLDEISVRFPIPIIENGQSPFYVALDRGYYSDEGLNVEFNMGSPELNPVTMVASGSDEIGVLGGPDTLLVARSRGVSLTAISVMHRNSNFSSIVTLEQSGIETVQDLHGKRLGMFYGHISTDVIRALLEQEGVEVEEVDVGFDYTPLITGRVDAEWAFTVTAGLDLPSRGVPINIINPSDYGIQTHGYTIFVTEDYLEENRDVILRFLRATFRGVSDVLAEPEAGVTALISRAPNLNRDLALERQILYNSVTTSDAPYYMGYMDIEMFAETHDRLASLGVLEGPVTVSDAFEPSIVQELSNQ